MGNSPSARKGWGRYQRKRNREQVAEEIKEIAILLLEAIHRGREPQIHPKYGNDQILRAYRLLRFEGLIYPRMGYALTEAGEEHVRMYGYQLL